MGKKYKVMDLFSGIGGFSLGFQRSGFDIVLAVDKNNRACHVYNKNIRNVEMICQDIQQIDINRLPDFDVLIGTVPTQNFRVAGKDSNIVNDILAKEREIIKSKMPKAFVLEKSGYLRKGEDIKELISDYIDLGYNVQWKCLESEKITGMPIRERRLYIVGLLDGEILFEFGEEARKSTFREIMQNAEEITDRNEESEKMAAWYFI